MESKSTLEFQIKKLGGSRVETHIACLVAAMLRLDMAIRKQKYTFGGALCSAGGTSLREHGARLPMTLGSDPNNCAVTTYKKNSGYTGIPASHTDVYDTPERVEHTRAPAQQPDVYDSREQLETPQKTGDTLESWHHKLTSTIHTRTTLDIPERWHHELISTIH